MRRVPYSFEALSSQAPQISWLVSAPHDSDISPLADSVRKGAVEGGI